MTPPPVTTAGRGIATAGRGTTTKERKTPGKRTGHAPRLERATAPKSPRRVSGPARTRTAPPQRPSVRPRRAPRARTQAHAKLAARSIAFVRGLPDHAVVDRLVRGRAWIPVIGLMLAGIVAMQVELLKLNASIGRSISRGTALQSTNEQLRASVAALADDQRIERIAVGMGMVMPAPTGVYFLTPNGQTDVQKAVAQMHTPDPAAFAALQPAPLSTAQGAAGTTLASTSAGVTPAASTSATVGSTPAATSTTSAGPAQAATQAPATQPTGAATAPSTAPTTAVASTPAATSSTSGGAAAPVATGPPQQATSATGG